LFTTKAHPKPRIMTTHTEDGRSGLLIDRNAGKGEEDGRSKGFFLILILLNGYGEIVNGALIHANRLALGWTEGYFCIVAAPWQFASQPPIT